MRDGFRAAELPEGKRIARKGGKGAAQSQARPTEHDNTLRSRSMARIIEVISEGVLQGVHTWRPGWPGDWWWQSVILDGTPVYTGSYNFTIYEAHMRQGSPSQDPVPGFPMAEVETAVGVECKPYDAVVKRLSSPDVSAVRVTLRFPAMYNTEQDGDVVGTGTAYEIDYSIDQGGWIYGYSENIFGKTISPYERSFRIQFAYQATTSIDVRVTRLWGEGGQGEANAFFWSTLTEIYDGQLSYDDTALMAVTIDAEDFPNIPQRAYLVDGIRLLVPNNYDPWTNTYSGDWDGTFKTDWTSNPAWVLYGLLTNERWGLGRFLDATAVDKWSFYEAGRYSDEIVPDGKGGAGPRWTCNCVINTRQDAWQVLTAIASTMCATLYFANGTVFCVQDRGDVNLSTPRLFGPADVVNGVFDYVGADYRSRHTAVAVTWNDPEDMYKPAVELVQDAQLVAEQGYKEYQTAAFGCTNRAQAIRLGRWMLYTAQHETEAVSFQIGLENADIRPGEVIAINDPSRAGARLSGRLLHDDGPDTITLDHTPQALGEIGGWSIYMQVGSAAEGEKPTVYAHSIVEALSETRFRISPAKPAGADAGTMWMLVISVVYPTWWRVAVVSDQGKGVYQVLATERDLNKFQYVDYGWMIPEPPHSLIPSGPLKPPTDINHAEYIYRDASGRPQFAVIISWTASPDPRTSRYQIELSGPAGDYRKVDQIAGISWEFAAMRQGEWQVRLRGFDNLGRASSIVAYSFIPVGLTARPVAAAGLYITPQGGNLTTLTWTPTSEIDVDFYWIKWTGKTVGATWDRATTSIARVDRNTTQINTPTRNGTYMIKAIDSLGQESDGWTAAVLEQQQTETSIFFDEAQDPAWAGTLGANWHHQGAELWLRPPTAPEPVPPGIFPGDRGIALNKTPTRGAIYDFDEGFDLGASTLVTMTGYVEAYGTKMTGTAMSEWTPISIADPLAFGETGLLENMSRWVPLALAVPLAKDTSMEWDAHIEARVSQDGTTFGPWFPLKSTVITGQAFEWRMVGLIYDLQTTLRADEAGVLIEVPQRSVQGSDVALDGSGQATVTYAAPFLVTPTVQLTARQTLSAGGNIVITESDTDHFKVQHRTASGSAASNGSIDYLVQGYGGHG